MKNPAVTAALLLAGVFWPAAAYAAAPPVSPLMAPASADADRSVHVVNFALGGVVAPSLGQEFLAMRPKAVTVTQGLQLDLGYGRNWDPHGDLFPAAATLNSAFLSGTHVYARAQVAFGREVSFEAGHVALGNGALSESKPSLFSRELAARLGATSTNAGTTTARLNWNFGDWGGVSLNAATASGHAALLGAGALGGARAAESSALGISARVGFGEGWVTTVTYAEGETQLGLSRNSLAASDSLRSEAYGIGFAKQGLFGDDALGIALTRPLQISSTRTGFGSLNTNFALANTHAEESDLALGYVTTFLDGTLALQANAAYQVNAAGTRGQNAVTGVARARLNF
jgi:hypothetical protein